MSIQINLVLPVKKKGRRSKVQAAQYHQDLTDFANGVLKLNNEIQQNLENQGKDKEKYSSRGWAYLMENLRLINKDQFDYIQNLINECRKKGLIPIDFVKEDKDRMFENVEDFVDSSYKTPKEHIKRHIEWLNDFYNYKSDYTFWQFQDCYIQCVVEKVDVVTVFNELCQKYHIPIANGKGWSSILMRAKMAERFKEAEELGKKTVLLYFGDHDPAGIDIADTMKKLLRDLELGTNYDPSNLIVNHFGLSYEFIEDNNIMWIDNLLSASGKKPNYKNPKIIDYISKYGERKVEANVIILPEIREKVEELFEETILGYLGDNPLKDYDNQIDEEKTVMKETLAELKIDDVIEDLLEKLDKIL